MAHCDGTPTTYLFLDTHISTDLHQKSQRRVVLLPLKPYEPMYYNKLGRKTKIKQYNLSPMFSK
jgi:hypothetical protein